MQYLILLESLRLFSMTLKSIVTSSKVLKFVLNIDSLGFLPSPFPLNPQGSRETNLVVKIINLKHIYVTLKVFYIIEELSLYIFFALVQREFNIKWGGLRYHVSIFIWIYYLENLVVNLLSL